MIKNLIVRFRAFLLFVGVHVVIGNFQGFKQFGLNTFYGMTSKRQRQAEVAITRMGGVGLSAGYDNR